MKVVAEGYYCSPVLDHSALKILFGRKKHYAAGALAAWQA